MLHSVVLFSDLGEVCTDAYVSSVSLLRGVSVMIPKYGLEEKLSLNPEIEMEKSTPQVGGEENRQGVQFDAPKNWKFERNKMKLTREKDGRTLQVFDKVKVKISVVNVGGDAKLQSLSIELVENGKEKREMEREEEGKNKRAKLSD